MTLKELRTYIDTRIGLGEFDADEPVQIEIAEGGRTEDLDDILIYHK